MTVWRLIQRLGVAQWPLGLAIILTIGMTASALGLLALSGWFLTAASIAGLAVATGAIGFNFLIPASLIRALAVTRTGLRYAERLLSHDATLRLVVKLRRYVFDGLLSELREQPGREQDALDRLVSDATVVEGALLRTLLPFIGAVIAALFTPILAVFLAPSAILPTLIPAGVLIGVVWWRRSGYQALAQQIDRDARRARERAIALADGRYELGLLLSTDELNALTTDAYSGLTTARLAKVKREQVDRWLLGIGQAFAVLGLILLPLELPFMVSLLLALLATAELMTPALSVSFEAERVRIAMQRMPTVMPMAPPQQHMTLAFEALQVAALPGQAPLTMPITRTLRPGDALIITGDSGVGKTTLLRTLAGFLPPASGTVVRPDQIGLVMQSPWLPEDQLRQVVTLGLSDTPTDEAIWNALETVELATWVRALPQGLDTWVGSDGVQPSGGQQRRLAIVRLLLQKPRLVLMDEPTEGLEPELATRIMARLAETFDQQIWIVVSHRPEPYQVIQATLPLLPLRHNGGSPQDLPYTAGHDALSNHQDL